MPPKPETVNRVPPGASSVMTCSARLETLRLKLCSVGLHPKYHDTPEKAAAAVCEMIAYLRRELADPPHDVQGLVLRKLGVEGWVREELGDKPATCKIVSLPNNRDEPTTGSSERSI